MQLRDATMQNEQAMALWDEKKELLTTTPKKLILNWKNPPIPAPTTSELELSAVVVKTRLSFEKIIPWNTPPKTKCNLHRGLALSVLVVGSLFCSPSISLTKDGLCKNTASCG